ncbi:hypothetical protein [Candidatus Nitrosotenuis aquarius]|uniref:hypothetical protein n=1 Tax=Candidatus Nitrosotenuis aquarius TaxID=1846278 RepID=UPI0013C347C9|nr:hypothetical protein [Candidatus Nitrosotenuis aquarius]
MLQVIAYDLGVIHPLWYQYGSKINEFVHIEKSCARGTINKRSPDNIELGRNEESELYLKNDVKAFD